jgi:hypothetical protein
MVFAAGILSTRRRHVHVTKLGIGARSAPNVLQTLRFASPGVHFRCWF